MLPANQGLGTHHGTRLHIDLGLVIQHKLALVERMANMLHPLALGFDGSFLLHIEEMVAIFARLLGHIHGLVRMAQQGIGSAPTTRLDDSVFEELGISREDADKVCERLHNATDDLKAIARDLAA